MSSLQLHETTTHTPDLKQSDHRLVFAVICLAALVLLAAVATFAPLPIGSEISNQMSLVGP